MIDLSDDVMVHVDYENHRLVMIDLGDTDVVHVDYK